jgi:hypothetical protein
MEDFKAAFSQGSPVPRERNYADRPSGLVLLDDFAPSWFGRIP